MRRGTERQEAGGLALYLVLTMAAAVTLRAYPTSAWKLPIALLPVAAFVLVLQASIRYPDRLSRNQRTPLLGPLPFAFLSTLVLTLTLGALEWAGAPRPPWILVPVFMLIFWSLGMFLTFRRAR